MLNVSRLLPRRRGVRLALAVQASALLVSAVSYGVNGTSAGAAGIGARPPVDAYAGNVTGKTVAVVGDSITALTKPKFLYYFKPAYRISVHGWSGATISEQQPTAVDYQARTPKPNIAVINLGSNDAQTLPRISMATARARIDTMLNTFSTASCLVLTTINANTLKADGTANTEFNNWANDFNFWVLFDLQNKNPKVRLVQWNNVVKDYYAAGSPRGQLTTDTLHPTDVGQDILAQHTISTVRSCP